MEAERQSATTPDVTVVIPTHNRHLLLMEALESVADQDWPSWECIVIDDGSEPPVSLPADLSQTKLVRRAVRGGPAAARNTGLRAATGRFIAFLDDDDLMVPSRIRIGMEALQANPDANCHIGALIKSDSPDLEKIPIESTSSTPRRSGTSRLSVEQILIRRDLVKEFDESLRVGEDVDWWLRVEPTVAAIVTLDVVTVVRSHDEVRPGVSSEVRFQARLRTYKKHRHLLPTWGNKRSRLQRRVAEAALKAGRPHTATRYAMAAVVSRPDMRKVKVLLMAGGTSFRKLLTRQWRQPTGSSNP